MTALRRSAAARGRSELPLFPLKTVLFPGGVLPLRIFEQRYIAMAKACLRDERPFGVCLITQGEEVARDPAVPPEFSAIGTLATIASWDMPEPGILHVTARGGERFRVRAHRSEADGLVVAETARIPAEPAVALATRFEPLVKLLELVAARVGPNQFPETRAYDDASWVGYRLAEVLPLPLSIKQGMLEINDSDVRLALLQKFLQRQGIV
ncbi:MAG TPA: LON peptidase substrate-binding domain-containing protein [Casimicrobiaceae bacterium]|nr:LON peptidase substrate-binding domain-containing protein [Casimicrobiaceae bacterium]